MSENRSLIETLSNRFFGIPTVAQVWAKLTARSTTAIAGFEDGIPFHVPETPLADGTFALITTGGIHLPDQPQFDMEDPDGDASYRIIPSSVDVDEVTITHKYYDHSDADQDLNVIFPLNHFRQLEQEGIIGGLAPRHFGFMGHIDGALVDDLTQNSAPEVAELLVQDNVDYAFLTPA